MPTYWETFNDMQRPEAKMYGNQLSIQDCIFKGLANRSLRSDMSFQACFTWIKWLTVHVFMF